MIKFTLSTSGKPVLVNRSSVAFVTDGVFQDEDGKDVQFSRIYIKDLNMESCFVDVRETVEEIWEILK